MKPQWILTMALGLLLVGSMVHAADKPIKTFICAGQSNMVGWGHNCDDCQRDHETGQCFVKCF